MAIFDPRDPGLESAFQAARQIRFDPLSEALGIVQRVPGAIAKTRELKEEKAKRKALSDLTGGIPVGSADEALFIEKIRSSREQGGPLDLETSNGIRALVGLPASNEPLSRQEARLLTQARSAKGNPSQPKKSDMQTAIEFLEKQKSDREKQGAMNPFINQDEMIQLIDPSGKNVKAPRKNLKELERRGYKLR